MSRIVVAAIGGPIGFVAYVLVVVALADPVAQAHWALQALFYPIAGVAWVWPAHRLILWAGRAR